MSTVNVGSSLPAGSNTVGNVKVVDTGGTNQLAVDANNNAHVTLYNAANAMAVDASNNAHVGVFNGSNQLAVNSGGNAAINLVQVAGNAVPTGTGASGSGVARVTVANDSQLQLWDGTNGPVAVELANESPDLSDKALITAISPNNTGLPVNVPTIVQKANNVTGSAGKTLTISFGSNTIKGNSIIVVMGMGEVEVGGGSPITLAVTDSQSNTYSQAVKASQSTTQEASIFYATNTAGGADTVTITIAGSGSSNTAIAAEIYEMSGLIAPSPLDGTSTGNNAGSTSPATGSVSPIVPNEYAFVAVAAAGGTITAGAAWTLDSGSLAPTGGNLVSFGSESWSCPTIASMTGTATLSSSNAWAIALATFRTVILPIEGSVNLSQVGGTAISLGQAVMANSFPVVLASNQSAVPASQSGTWTVQPGNTANTTAWLVQPVAGTSGGSTPYHLLSANSNNATSLKASAGLVYGYSFSSTNASARWVKFYDKASAPAPASDTVKWAVEVPGNAVVSVSIPEGMGFTTGIAFAAVTGSSDTDNTSVGAGDLSIDIRYK